METEPSDADESTPPAANAEEPVPAVPTSETTPVWAHTVPVEPAESAEEAAATAGDEEALPALPMQKGDPDWSKTQTPSPNGESTEDPPGWATTVPTSPGEDVSETPPAAASATVESEASAPPEPAPAPTEPPPAIEAVEEQPAAEPPMAVEPVEEQPPMTQPLKSAAGDATKSSWPPAAEPAPAPPEETDIWPPEPPTEPAMPAWPPLSELAGRGHASAADEEPATPAQAIPSWPDSFDPTAATAEAIPPTITPAPAKPAPGPGQPMPAPSPAPPAPPPVRPMPAPAPRPDLPPAAAASAPSAPTPSQAPVAPSTPAPARPAWAPGPVAPAHSTPPRPMEAEPMQVPAWAPRVPLAGEPGKPTWFSPKEQIPHATAQPIVPPAPVPEPAPTPPMVGGHLPVAPVPKPAAPAQPGTARSTWEVVEQHGKTDKSAKVSVGPTAEDRSYAEWFAWAKRGGAPASACHAAAQGAFKALSSGKDVMTAVQWATAAMSQPPENVAFARQQYCAWFSLANIDLNLDQHRAHLFAGAAVQALDAGQDPSGAHAAGLAAAGIR